MRRNRFDTLLRAAPRTATPASDMPAPWACDLATEALSWSDGVFAIFGLPADHAIERREAVSLYCDESRETMEWLRAGAIATRRGFSMDAEIARPDGTRRWMRLVAHVACEKGRPVRLHGTKQDITAERLRIAAMHQETEHDPLTGLLNRAGFARRFLDRPAPASEFPPLGALVLVQMTDLDAINTHYGFAAGDMCLSAIAARLSGALPPGAVAARIDGGCFALLLPPAPVSALLDATITRLLSDAALAMPWDGQPLPVSLASSVIRPVNPMIYDAEELLAAAQAELGRRLF